MSIRGGEAALSIALALLAIALSGAGLTVRLRGGLRIAAALLLGIGAWSAAYAATLLLFGAGPRALLAKDAALALTGALVTLHALRKRKGDHRSPPPSGKVISDHLHEVRGWQAMSFAFACLLATAAVVEHTLRFPTAATTHG